ncbi:MAG: tetratricopeptide repeat protein [Chloroflexota bacterium]
MNNRKEKQNKPLFMGEPFERMIAILIALATLLIAVAALLEANAEAQVAQAIRRSQQFAIQAIGVQASGETQTGYAWTEAYRNWLEWDQRVFLAEVDENPGAARRYEAIRDRARGLSPLLAPPYFEPEEDEFPNIRAFEATTYVVENTILAERFIAAIDLADALEDKEKAYGTHILLLTVSLFLFGLSTTVVGRVSWLFVGLGAVIANISLAWLGMTYVSEIEAFSDEAIVAYGQGVGFAYQDDYVSAVASFDEAIELEPEYANAYYARANAYFDQGGYEQAAADYESALEAGREDIAVPWNLGWTYYVSGQPDEAIALTEQALQIDDSRVALHFNLALAQLSKGEILRAEETYAQGIAIAAEQVEQAQTFGEAPPSSLWWYLGTAGIDLDNLVICLESQACEGGPPYSVLPKDEAVQTAAIEIRNEIKQATVGLEHLRQLPSDRVNATIDQVQFASPIYDEDRNISGFEALEGQQQLRFGQVQEAQGEQLDVNITRASPEDAKEIFILFGYEGLMDGQLLTIKIYTNQAESVGLRLVEDWTLGEGGQAALPLTPGSQFALAPGEYSVEIYVDAHLVQESAFTIQENE